MNTIDTTDSLIDLARAEDLTDDEFLTCFAETLRERDIIEKLKGPGAHLLEGPRGVGKSSLLKKAELELDETFHVDKSLAIYINFKASLLVETGTSELGFDPFLCWVAAKILDGLYKKCLKLGVVNSDLIAEKYRRLLSVTNSWSPSDLQRTISDLQGLAMAGSQSARQEIAKRLTKVGLERFANIETVAEFVGEIARETRASRMIFLFDEAAHTFDPQQQETFFQLFKLLHGGIVAVKAATYPGITSYGGNFEVGQDAIRLSISSVEENLRVSQDTLREHFRELVRRRVPGSKFGQMVKQGEALDLLVLLSHGNPRLLLQTVSKWLASGELTKRSALRCSNDYVGNELTSYHLGLKQRLPRFASHIDLGMALVKAHLVPEIQKKNQGKGEDPKIQTIYFTMDPLLPYKIHRAVNLLEYSGFLFRKGVVKIAQRRQAPRFALHLGVAANERVFHSRFSRDPDRAIRRLSIADYREFYASDARFTQLLTDHPEQENCPNGHPRQTEGAYCAVCGIRFDVDKVLARLLNDPVSRLSLSDFLRRKLSDDFQATTIRDVLRLTETDLQTAYLIGPVRSRRIVNAAEEYISG